MRGDNEDRISNQFGGFCTRVLKNEAYNIRSEYDTLRKREKSLSELTRNEYLQLAMNDSYFANRYIFNVNDVDVVVVGDDLGKALMRLTSEYKDIILLFYFLGLTDREISRILYMSKAQIFKRRTKALKQLNNILQEDL